MKYRGILFDLDGTLLDTLEDIADGVNYAMEKYGCPLIPLSDVRAFVGNGLENLMIRCIPDGADDPRFYEIYGDFKKYYLEHCLIKTKPYDGIMELLKKLSEADSKVAVISNKNDIAVKELNKVFFSEYIPVAIGESESVRKKPAPDTVFQAMKELELSSQECVYIGDSEVDILTAKNAGIPCITVTWGFRDRDFLAEKGAVTFADTAEQLLTILEEN